MSIRVGVLLSGCGVFDGSEIHEAVSILVALDKQAAQAICLAPNLELQTIDHLTAKPEGSSRNVLRESARIARGKIRDLAEISADDLDALILPGGYGAAKNLCSFAQDGVNCRVHPQVERLLLEMHQAKKPMGFACIAPVIAARVFGSKKMQVRLTIGTDPSTAQAINSMGACHENAGPIDALVDESHRIVSTACYMNDVGPATVYQGAENLVKQVLRLASAK